MNTFIREDINRIKRKKSKFKGKLSIFNCLTSPIESSISPISIEKLKEQKFKELKQQRKEKLKFNRYEEYDLLCRIDNLNKQQKKRKRKLERKLFVKKDEYSRKRIKHRRIGKINYKEYIKSDLWVKRKNKLFQLKGRFCEKCKSSEKISVHHLRYIKSEFGNEKDTDLAIMCWKCHTKFHEIYGVHKDSHKDYSNYLSTVLL